MDNLSRCIAFAKEYRNQFTKGESCTKALKNFIETYSNLNVTEKQLVVVELKNIAIKKKMDWDKSVNKQIFFGGIFGAIATPIADSYFSGGLTPVGFAKDVFGGATIGGVVGGAMNNPSRQMRADANLLREIEKYHTSQSPLAAEYSTQNNSLRKRS